jgi:maltooligosyltrehalose trehalohydrolase
VDVALHEAPGGQTMPVRPGAEVIAAATFRWADGAWMGRPLSEMVICEVHVGTATPAGTFDELVN